MDTIWYYAVGQEQKGPVSEAELIGLYQAGTINDDTLVWRDGMANWAPYRQAGPGRSQAATVPEPLSLPAVSAESGFSEAQAKQAVQGPSIGLLVTGILVALDSLLAILLNIFGVAIQLPSGFGDPEIERMLKMMDSGMGLVVSVVKLGLAGLTIYAALEMGKLRNHALVTAMLVINMIPCCNGCCCLVGLPIGIWGLTVLAKPEIKKLFH